MDPNLSAAIYFCNTHGGHDMRSGAAWAGEGDYPRKYVCLRCGRELVAVEGDISGNALYEDCDLVRWRKIALLDALHALDEGTIVRAATGNLYTVFPLRGLCVENESRTSLPLGQVPLPVWAMDQPRA